MFSSGLQFREKTVDISVDSFFSLRGLVYWELNNVVFSPLP